MFSRVRKILGLVKVDETNTEIVITGIPARTMTRDISKIWKTSVIESYMFTKVTKSSLSFPKFFAADVVYMLEKMTKHRSTWTDVRTLSKIKELLLTNTWLKSTQDNDLPGRLDFSKINQLIYTPLDYQMAFLKAYDTILDQYHLNGYLLAASAGSGKTYLGLTIAECIGADRVVIVCPKNAIHRVWESEIVKLYKKQQSYWIAALGKPYKGERFLIFHFETLNQAVEMIPEINKGRKIFVALDESHNLNEMSSTRTHLFLQLTQRLNTEDVIWASGTAIKALGSEAVPLLKSIDPYFTPEAEARFRKIYGKDGKRGLDILQHRMGIISFKVEKAELGLEKPIIKSLPITIPNGKDYTLASIRRDMAAFIEERVKYYKKHRKEHERLYNECIDIYKKHLDINAKKPSDWNDFSYYERTVKMLGKLSDYRTVPQEIQWTNAYEKNVILPTLPPAMKHTFRDVKSIIKYTPLKIQGEALGRVLGRKRIECHVDMIPFVDFRGICESTTKKTVVFTSFVEVLEASRNKLTAEGLNPVVVYGKTNNELARTVAQFEKEEDLNPLIATYQSLSTAVPLVMADTLIMLNAPFRAYIYEQAISRVHRLGADTQVVVYEARLDTGNEPNISTRSSDILKWSQEMVTAIMGVSSPYIDVDNTGMESHGDISPLDDFKQLSEAFEAHYGFDLGQPMSIQQAPYPVYLEAW